MYILVSPFTKTFDEVWLVYFVPDFLVSKIKIWQAVEIPVKTSIEIAIILEIIAENNLNINISKIKSIISIKNENILIKKYQFSLIKWIAKYYFSSIHNSLNLFFPTNVKDKIKKGKLEILIQSPYPNPLSRGEGTWVSSSLPLGEIEWGLKKIWKSKNLSKVQNKVFNEIRNSTNNKILFYWITWSWKTEIYIKLIQECISSWKQALLLIPEIILTNQISEKIKTVFWEDNVRILNSSISPASKTKAWLDLYIWNTKIIVWTRSSIFYPFNDLWLIIIDEEHDNSYISDKTPRYHTEEIAEQISDNLNIKLILASGTPSIKNMYKSIKGKYKLVTLLEKYK